MPSLSTYHLTWVSLTLHIVYPFMAAPAKCSCCSLPCTRGICLWLPLLTLNVEWLLLTLLCLHSHCSVDVGLFLSVSYHFAFSYCSWGSQGKNTEVVCHSLLWWTTFFQTSPPWLVHLGGPHTAWLSFIELDKAVILV